MRRVGDNYNTMSSEPFQYVIQTIDRTDIAKYNCRFVLAAINIAISYNDGNTNFI
jgi:hypothetical protein